MIGSGAFNADVARAIRLVDDLELTAYQNPRPANDSATIRRIRGATTYREEYEAYVAAQAIDLMLNDGSVVFFRRAPEEATLLSYGFLECPYDALSYPDFIAEFFGSDARVTPEAWDEYEEYRSQVPLRPHVTPLRYDWSPSLYREGAHPAAHLHVGFRTQVRLSVDALLTPAQFVLFVLRHFYLSTWETSGRHHEEVAKIAKCVSDEHVVPKYRKGGDHLELRLVSFAGGQRESAPTPRSPRQ